MKMCVKVLWTAVGILAIPLHNIDAQQIKGLLTVTPAITAPESATAQAMETPVTYYSPFKKDPLITIKEDSTETYSGVKQKVFAMKSVWELFDTESAQTDNTVNIEKKNFIEIYYLSLSEALQADPFYHVGRDTENGAFIYDEQAWDALANTLRKRYKIVRAIENTMAKVENKVTLRYETDSRTVYKARPGIEMVGGKEYAILRFSIRQPRQHNYYDTRISERGIKVRISNNFSHSQLSSSLSLEHESCKSENPENNDQWEQISQICLRVPIW